MTKTMIGIEAGIIDFYSKANDQIRYKLEETGKEMDGKYTKDIVIRYGWSFTR